MEIVCYIGKVWPEKGILQGKSNKLHVMVQITINFPYYYIMRLLFTYNLISPFLRITRCWYCYGDCDSRRACFWSYLWLCYLWPKWPFYWRATNRISCSLTSFFRYGFKIKLLWHQQMNEMKNAFLWEYLQLYCKGTNRRMRGKEYTSLYAEINYPISYLLENRNIRLNKICQCLFWRVQSVLNFPLGNSIFHWEWRERL